MVSARLSPAVQYSLALVVLLAVLLLSIGGSYWLSLTAVHRATASTASTVQLCLAGNEARAQQVQLWTFLISISRPPPHQTRAEAAQRAATIRRFTAYVHRVFQPRNCQRFH